MNDNEETTQAALIWDVPTVEWRRSICNPDNPINPFSKYIGNKEAVRRLCRAAFHAWGDANHDCGNQAFALLGPASTGKTSLARMFGQLLKLPFVEINPQSCKTVNDISKSIAEVLETFPIENSNETLGLFDYGNGNFILPPMVIFLDEAHNLSKRVVQGLLKAVERNDAVMVDENDWKFDTSRVCWMIATTDRGSLFDAFDTRFTKINLNLYTLDEMTQIVQVHNPDWDVEVCELVAKFSSRTPREALAFAKEMREEQTMNGGDWESVAEVVAKDNGIDEFGMQHQRLAILKALGQEGAISKARLCVVANCKQAELEKFVLPPMLASTADQRALITVTGKGYAITKTGLSELDLRSIPYAPDLFTKRQPLSKRLGRNNLN